MMGDRLFWKLASVGGMAVAAAVGLLGSGHLQTGTIAYQVPYGTNGNQAWSGPLGLDFNVQGTILVTHLGVFDDGSNGLSRNLVAYIYDRNSPASPVVSLSFPTTDPGQLIGGSRFKPLPTPMYLPFGFQGSMVAENYGTGELNGNSGGATPVWTTDSGGGALAFVGGGRYGTTQGQYPPYPDGGPANRYAAGSFMFAPFDPYGQAQFAFPLGVPVPNFGFEQPVLPSGGWSNTVPGWTVSGSAGVFRPTSSEFPGGVPEGQQIAFVNSGGALTATLGETLQPNTLYILDVDWGRRTDNPSALHSMTLRAGGVELGWVNNSTIGNGPVPPVGGWSTARGYFTANHNASIGSPLEIRLSQAGSGQSSYDNVRLQKITGAAILLNNPSFEMDDVPEGGSQVGPFGWTATGNAGVYQGASEITPADGQQSAYVTGGARLTQTLAGVPLRNDYLYILMVDVADRRSTTFAGYQVELLAGGQTLAMDNNSLGVLQATDTAGYFYTTAVVTFRGINHPLAGQDLGIRLTALGEAANQTYFDNVRLFAYWVPEPSSGMLLLLGGGIFLAARVRAGFRGRKGQRNMDPCC